MPSTKKPVQPVQSDHEFQTVSPYRFQIVPLDVIQDASLTSDERFLWCLILSFCNFTGDRKTYARFSTVADLTGWGQRKVKDTRASLVKKGMLQIEQVHHKMGGSHCIYKVLDKTSAVVAHSDAPTVQNPAPSGEPTVQNPAPSNGQCRILHPPLEYHQPLLYQQPVPPQAPPRCQTELSITGDAPEDAPPTGSAGVRPSTAFDGMSLKAVAELVWEAHPKKQGDKKKCLAKLTKELSKLGQQGAKQVLDLTKRYSAAFEALRGTSEWSFVPYAATWLNGQRWLEDPTDWEAEALRLAQRAGLRAKPSSQGTGQEAADRQRAITTVSMAKRRLKFAKSVISRMVNDGKSTPEKIEQQKKVVEDLQEEVKKLSPPTQARPMAITPNAG
jgi:hypothetical protein